ADRRPPSSGARFVAVRSATECNRAGAGDDDDARTESDRAGQRDARVVIDREVAARKKDRERIDNLLTMCRMIGTGDSAVRVRNLPDGDAGLHERDVDRALDVPRRLLDADAQMIRAAGETASERRSVLVGDERCCFRCAAVDAEEESLLWLLHFAHRTHAVFALQRNCHARSREHDFGTKEKFMKRNRILTIVALSILAIALIAAAGCKTSGMALTSRGQLLKININHPTDLPESGEDNLDVEISNRGVNNVENVLVDVELPPQLI